MVAANLENWGSQLVLKVLHASSLCCTSFMVTSLLAYVLHFGFGNFVTTLQECDTLV